MEQASYLNADNIAMFTLLELKDQSEFILVCNTHLVFPANQGDKKLSQVIVIMKAIQTILENFSNIKNDI